MNIDELREYQSNFESTRRSLSTEFKSINKLRSKFKKDFSVNVIKQLKKDDYVIGKGKPTFCNRIENELNAWGNIHNSPAIKFGVYYGVRNGSVNKAYQFAIKHGENFNKAFSNVKLSILDLIKNKNHLELLKKNLISPMFKGKILSVYFPDKFLNIYSASHLNYFINNLGLVVESKSELDKQNELLIFKNSDPVMKQWSIYEYSKFLYHSFGRPNDEINDKNLAPELKGYKLKDFPPIESINAEFVELQTGSNNNKSKRKKKKSSKTDYSSQSKRFKIIGERGEQVVLMMERKFLRDNNRDDLSRKVEQVSNYDDYLGYDILSFDLNGRKKHIEVKSTLRSIGSCDVYLSSNELEVSKQKNNYYFYIVFNVGEKEPKIWSIKSNEFLSDGNIELKATQYRISLKTDHAQGDQKKSI